jgi:uncharacterized protein YjbJ (UPF0337 family)
MKGRAKEAAGALTGDKKLKREGQLDQVTGQIKKKMEDAVDKVEEAVDKVKDALKGGKKKS